MDMLVEIGESVTLVKRLEAKAPASREELQEALISTRKSIRSCKKLMHNVPRYPTLAYAIKPAKQTLDSAERSIKVRLNALDVVAVP